MKSTQKSVESTREVRWQDALIILYKNNIDKLLENIALDPHILSCTDHECTVHHDAIELLRDNIISCCLAASKSIPTKKSLNHKRQKCIPGWNEYVKPYRSDALFWTALGYLSDIRRSTLYKYHNVLRKVRRQEKHVQAMKMAENLDGCHHGEFWASIKKMKGDKSSFPLLLIVLEMSIQLARHSTRNIKVI